MNQRKCLLSTILLLGLPAWAGALDCNSLSAARWMLGDWVTGDWKSITHESWTERGLRTFEGMGSERSMADGKTMNSEELRLVEMADGVFYLAKVGHNELPIAFALTECSNDRLVFENPEHDSPRRLEYRHEADDRMVVTISDGKNAGATLIFQREVAAPDGSAPVLAAEDARFAAMIGTDATRLRSWLADDLQYVHSTGDVESRQQFVDSIVSGERRYSVTPVEREVIMLGDQSALVRGRGQFQVVIKEAARSRSVTWPSTAWAATVAGACGPGSPCGCRKRRVEDYHGAGRPYRDSEDEESVMSKGMDKKREDKKKPQRTLERNGQPSARRSVTPD